MIVKIANKLGISPASTFPGSPSLQIRSESCHRAAPESVGSDSAWSAWLKPYFVNMLLGGQKRPGSPPACQTTAAL